MLFSLVLVHAMVALRALVIEVLRGEIPRLLAILLLEKDDLLELMIFGDPRPLFSFCIEQDLALLDIIQCSSTMRLPSLVRIEISQHTRQLDLIESPSASMVLFVRSVTSGMSPILILNQSLPVGLHSVLTTFLFASVLDWTITWTALMMKYLVNLSKSLDRLWGLLFGWCGLDEAEPGLALCEKEPLDCRCRDVKEPRLGEDLSSSPSIGGDYDIVVIFDSQVRPLSC